MREERKFNPLDPLGLFERRSHEDPWPGTRPESEGLPDPLGIFAVRAAREQWDRTTGMPIPTPKDLAAGGLKKWTDLCQKIVGRGTK